MTLLERWARFSHRRRGRIVAVWFVLLIALVGAGEKYGGEFLSEFTLPGAEAQKGVDLLTDRFPARSGSDADVVFEAPKGINDPAVQKQITAVLETVSQNPGVAAVESPLENPLFVAPGGTIARAVVHWKEQAHNISKADFHKFLDDTDAANSPELTVVAGGEVVALNETPEFGNEFIGLIFAVLILLGAFGSVIAVGLPIGAAIFGLGAGFAAILLGTNITSFPTFSPQFAAMIGLGVGIDYSLLVVTRFREGLHSGSSVEDSIVLAVTTAGRSVIFAGLVVAFSFLGLYLMGLPFIAALGTAGAIVVVVSVLVSLTLMPAFLAIVGNRVDTLKVPFLHNKEGVDQNSVWFRLSERIQKSPVLFASVATLVLLVLASPVLSMRLGFTDAGNSAPESHIRRAYDLISKGFGPGANGTVYLVADLAGVAAGDLEKMRQPVQAADASQRPAAMAGFEAVKGGPLDAISGALAKTEGIAPSYFMPLFNPAGDTALFAFNPSTSPQHEATSDLVHRLRDDVLPPVATNGIKLYVSGAVAGNVDAGDRISARTPLLFIGVIGVSFILLMTVFRSVLVALKAAIMNLLSIGAAYGVVVAVFQWGWGADLIGIQPGPIETFLPMMMFAILFGLSMDYEVFLISRVREEYLATGKNSTAVSHGLSATARVITAAAAIMVTVFLTFVLGNERVIKEFGVGLATAIFVDATIVRLFLVPATMELLGDRNWWMPRWLDRVLPNVNVEGPVHQPVEAGAPAGGQ